MALDAGALPTAVDGRSPSVAVPAIALPKGGGAIRGIGEKFAANPVTGTASLSIPIFAPPGRGGFGPQLTVAYDSGNGNGIAGVGMSIPLPAITRKTDKGLPRYFDADESDVFILSGSEDLVPVLAKKADGAWDVDPLGNIRFAESVRDGHRVRQYRPRIEGLFARIERWIRVADGDTHWRSISRDNVLTVYGRDAKSRIANPDDASQVFSWLVSESYDDKGNAVAYTYVREDDADVALTQANERNRSRSANLYPKTVRYGNRVPVLIDTGVSSMRGSHLAVDLGKADWMFEVVFDFGEGHYHEEAPDADGRIFAEAQLTLPPGASWKARKDPFSGYRSGFEIRCHRLCRRVLVFHHFSPALGTADCLVRATEFRYSEGANGSFLVGVQQAGFKRRSSDGKYLKGSLPAVTLSYSSSPLDDGSYEQLPASEIEAESLQNLPQGVDGPFRWIDLDGEGIAGVLTEQADAWLYKPNLGEGRFGPAQMLDRQPSLGGLNAGLVQLLDLAGDGRIDLVDLAASRAGYFSRSERSGWEVFRLFCALPDVDWKDPNLRFVDLTGDGLADVLVASDPTCRTWYQSLGEMGFSAASTVFAAGEKHGPQFVFADNTQTIFLADMSGDGLADLVRIRQAEVSYFPNLGYGRFGAKVQVDGAPLFDDAESFDPRRIRLTDVDGSGTADVLYLGRDGVSVYLNQQGNSLSRARKIARLPAMDTLGSVGVVDLLGRGTACLLWSSSLPGDAQRCLRYIDLMNGIKPHLLVAVCNNLGVTTTVSYSTSTRFYLADKAAGTPWVTRLPFPVHVVETVQIADAISGNRFVTRYAYHHGHFDGVEREFRGFGRVDQWDSQDFAILDAQGNPVTGTNLDAAFRVPPVLTKTWYHTGAYRGADRISRHLEQEYFREGDPDTGQSGLSDAEFEAILLPDTVLPQLAADEIREAMRSLKGLLLRQEVYARDGSAAKDLPYSVSERNYTVEPIQPRGGNRHSVFFTHARETIEYRYERRLFPVLNGTTVDDAAATSNPAVRRLADPRVAHAMVLACDPYGNVTQSLTIAYGRRFDDMSPGLTDADREDQKRTSFVLTDATYTRNIADTAFFPDAYRAPLAASSSTYELINFTAAYKQAVPAAVFEPGMTNLLRFEVIRQVLGAANDGAVKDIPYEDVFGSQAPVGTYCRRLIERTETRYRKEDLTQLLAKGDIGPLAVPGEHYALAFTPALIDSTYRRKTTGAAIETLLPDPESVMPIDAAHSADRGGYVHLDADAKWWIPSGRIYYAATAGTAAAESTEAAAHFFMPRRFVDAFGQATTIDYVEDAFLRRTTDPVGNVITAELDFRVLQPACITDPNGNRTFAAFDALGLTVANAVCGKADQNIGDSLDDFADADADPALADTQAFTADPVGKASTLLKSATSRFVYDLDRYRRCGQPPFAASLLRETHASEAPGGATRIQIAFTYSDGLGREAQTKIRAESGPAPQRDAGVQSVSGDWSVGKLKRDGSGGLQAANSDPRWVGKGRTVYNNKGKPVRQFEPFFSCTHLFEPEAEMTDTGVTPTLFYDPVGRVVATLHPDHSYEKVVFDPWLQRSWDANDTVLLDPTTDRDVAGYFAGIPPADCLPTWYQRRTQSGAPPDDAAAAKKAALHAATPAVVAFDGMGHAFLALADNGPDGGGQPQLFRTASTFDVEGNVRSVVDAKGRTVIQYDYDMLGHRIHQSSMEAGQRWMLDDASGKPIRAWDGRGHDFTTEYDASRRPIRRFVRGTTSASDPRTFNRDVLFEKTEYGEDSPDDTGLNLRTRVLRQSDTAGVIVNRDVNRNSGQPESYDFKGNLLRSTRTFVRDAKALPDWSNPPGLAQESFVASSRFDALNRVTQSIAPHVGDATALRVVQHIFNEANLLEQIVVWLAEAAEPGQLLDPLAHAPSKAGVDNVDYDARGQRVRIDYRNGVSTDYDYDPETFRLTGIATSLAAGASGLTTQLFQSAIQDLRYTSDAAGNVTHVEDGAIRTIVHGGEVVEPSCDYTYDPLYRLIQASGREHIGQTASDFAPPAGNRRDFPFAGLRAQPFDAQAMRNYTEAYGYDEVGNLSGMSHAASGGGWTRAYKYDEASLIEGTQRSNRLTKSKVGNDVETYGYADAAGNDAQGCMTSINAMAMTWDFRDRLMQVDLGGGGTAYYVYDAAGQRVRKILDDQNGALRKQRYYLGMLEEYWEYAANDPDNATLQRESLHVMDDKRRIALVEMRTSQSADANDPALLIRYQIGNHLESVSIELDESAQLISYEEYTPYGCSSFQAAPGQVKSSKRYRFTGKERDEETAFNYHGARYYVLWIGRWSSPDPGGLLEGSNLFVFTRNNPARLIDPTGLISEETSSRVVSDFVGLIEARYTHWVGKIARPGMTASELGTQAMAKLQGELTAVFGKGAVERVFSKVGSAHRIDILFKKLGLGIEGKLTRVTSRQLRVFADAAARDGKILAYIFKGNSWWANLGKEITAGRADAIAKATQEFTEHIHQVDAAAAKAGAEEAAKAGSEVEKGIATEGGSAASEAARASEEAARGVAKSGEVGAKAGDEIGKEIAQAGAKESAKAGEEVGKELAKTSGRRFAKFIPFVGIGIGVYQVQKDLRQREYGEAAIDAVEAVPFVGDVVGAAHLGLIAGIALGHKLFD